MAERKEWFSVKIMPTGTLVTASVQEDNLSVKKTVKSSVMPKTLKASVAEARKGARDALALLKEAVAESG